MSARSQSASPTRRWRLGPATSGLKDESSSSLTSSSPRWALRGTANDSVGSYSSTEGLLFITHSCHPLRVCQIPAGFLVFRRQRRYERLSASCTALYRPRKVRDSALYRLVDQYYARVKGTWEVRFERSYGFWRGSWTMSCWPSRRAATSKAAELLFRPKVIAFLRDEDLLSEARIELLLSWQNTGFSVHHTVTVGVEDGAGTERLARYLLRPPLSLERMSWAGEGCVLYRRKAQGRFGGSQTPFDGMALQSQVTALLAC